MVNRVDLASLQDYLRNGAAPESNRPSRGLHGRTGFEDKTHGARKEPSVRLDLVSHAALRDPLRDCSSDLNLRRSSAEAAHQTGLLGRPRAFSAKVEWDVL